MSRKLTREEFIKRAREVHGDKYDYSKVDLEHRDEKGRVCIVCPIHGEFWQKPSHHLDGHECRRCISSKSRKRKKSEVSEGKKIIFIEKAKSVHGNKYDYSKVEYINSNTKVCIICPIHGEFWQTPDNHLQGKGCKQCGFENAQNKQKKTTEKFIEEARNVHLDKYDYSNVLYKNKNTKIEIKCKKCGKVFLMTPHNHLIHKEGCPFCRESKLEIEVEQLLKENGIGYETQKVFEWAINGKSVKRLDFYLPQYNIAIECQGLQHFKPIKWFGGDENYNKLVENDELKIKMCEKHNIKLLHYSTIKFKFPYEVITSKEELLSKIR